MTLPVGRARLVDVSERQRIVVDRGHHDRNSLGCGRRRLQGILWPGGDDDVDLAVHQLLHGRGVAVGLALHVDIVQR